VAAVSFSSVGEGERDRAVTTLVSAFIDDPVERWLYPDLSDYLRHFPRFVTAFGGAAFEDGTVWKLGECEAVAFWLGPGVGADGDAIVTALSETITATLHPDAFATLDQMDRAHPRQPHWYLPWFGVERALQGRGFGTTLLTQCLAIVDASRLPAYLETPNPRTVSFYERHGFELTGTAQAGTCPPITLMLRPAAHRPG
jgi:ribosomal protein S18 acetylase RimI-like enzyme